MHKGSYYGVGFEGSGPFKIYSKSPVKSKAGLAWVAMIRRCYDEKYKSGLRGLDDCLVDERWHNFQNFAKWFYDQKACKVKSEVDKDILEPGNKEYSEDKCCLVPYRLNRMFIRSENATGVRVLKSGKFVGVYRNNYKNISQTFENYEDARKFYVDGKMKLVVDFISENIELIDKRIIDKFVKEK